MTGLELPVDTTAEDRAKAHAAIVQVLAENNIASTDYPCFALPIEWVRKGNYYGSKSILIVIHDGYPLAPFFNPTYHNHPLMREMRRALEKAGFWVELCTSTYSAIYKGE